MSASNLRRLLAVVLLLLLVASAAYWFYRRDTGTSADTLQVYGNVDVREVDLAFNNSEHIATLLVEEGDWVKENEPLAILEDVVVAVANFIVVPQGLDGNEAEAGEIADFKHYPPLISVFRRPSKYTD